MVMGLNGHPKWLSSDLIDQQTKKVEDFDFF